MSREALLAELNGLLNLGEPLLALFPEERPDRWRLRLPDNISYEMRFYADDVAWRARNREHYQASCRQGTTAYLAEWVEDYKVGLLGWRAIGVLK